MVSNAFTINTKTTDNIYNNNEEDYDNDVNNNQHLSLTAHLLIMTGLISVPHLVYKTHVTDKWAFNNFVIQ